MESVDITPLGKGREFQTISSADRKLVTISNLNSNFGAPDDYIELHVYDENGGLLLNDYDATDYYPYITNNPKNNTYSNLTLDPEKDLRNRGFNRGNLNIEYNFYKKLFNSGYGTFYWIKEISTTRTELKLASQDLSDSLIRSSFASYQSYISNKNYYPIFYLNFGNNQTVIAVNVAITEDADGSYILVKLYEPLPNQFDLKSQLWMVDKIADSVNYNVNIQVEAETQVDLNRLRGANFNVKVNTKNGQTTPYYTYNNLIQSPVTSSYQKLKSYYQDKAIELNVDYSYFGNFVHFSSAVQRVNNFIYKLQQIESANSVIQQQLDLSGGGSAASSSITAEQKAIDSIIKNFDIYEYFLYFESSSWAWPKSNSTQPYTLYSVTSSQAKSFIGSETTVPNATTASLLFSASYYDATNKDLLHNSIPQYILDDSSNQPYIYFLDMIGQHFDNIWVYYKDISNRFDATNNPNTGISLDLVSDALKGLGTQLYTNTNVSDNLYYTMFGINPDGSLLPPTGSEIITNYVTSSLQTLPAATLQDEIYKRLYHNLPYLLKTKGTARGIKTLISSYGIPESMLKVREFGGNIYNELAGVLDLDTSEYKVTIDTGSFKEDNFVMTEVLQYITDEVSDYLITDSPVDQGTVTGSLAISSSLLSPYTTLQYYIGNRRLNSTNIEIGFSPSETINSNIVASQGNFNIDQLVGSPGYRYSSSYEPLVNSGNAYFSSYTQPHSVWEYIRLLKFYNNSLFKTIKDFVPARANVSTGLIIKSHLYERNKYARHEPSFTFNEYSQSIHIGTISGSEGGALTGDTDSSGYVMTISGSVYVSRTDDVEKYNGELSGSYIRITSGEAFPQVEISQLPAPFTYNELVITENDNLLNTEVSDEILTEDQVGNPYYVVPINALFQNVTSSVRSQVLLDLDYTGDQLKPINYGIVTYSISQSQVNNYSTYANRDNPYAEVQDYNYNLKRSLIPRYSGSKTISATYNTYTPGDESYGKTAAIDKLKYQYAYLVNIFSSSFQLPGRTRAQIKYIIDNSQNILNLSKTNKNIFSVQNIFKAGEWVDVSLFDYDPNNPFILRLNNSERDFTIWESGYIYSPVLYNIEGSSSLTYERTEPSSSLFIATIPGKNITINSTDIDYWVSPSVTKGKVTSTYGGINIETYFVTGSSFPATKTTTIGFTVTNNVPGRSPSSTTFNAYTPIANTYTASYFVSPVVFNWQTGDSISVTIDSRTYKSADVNFTSSIYFLTASDNNPKWTAKSSRQIFLSQQQSQLYGSAIQYPSTSSNIETPVFPIEAKYMDIVRLYNTSSGFSINSEYRVVSVERIDSGSNSSYIALNLDRDLNTGDLDSANIPTTISKYILLKRLQDETIITFNYNLPKSINNDGILFPQYIEDDVRDNSGNVIKALKQQNLI